MRLWYARCILESKVWVPGSGPGVGPGAEVVSRNECGLQRCVSPTGFCIAPLCWESGSEFWVSHVGSERWFRIRNSGYTHPPPPAPSPPGFRIRLRIRRSTPVCTPPSHRMSPCRWRPGVQPRPAGLLPRARSLPTSLPLQCPPPPPQELHSDLPATLGTYDLHARGHAQVRVYQPGSGRARATPVSGWKADTTAACGRTAPSSGRGPRPQVRARKRGENPQAHSGEPPGP